MRTDIPIASYVSIQLISLASRGLTQDQLNLANQEVSIQLISLASRENLILGQTVHFSISVSIQLISLASREGLIVLRLD